LAIDIVWRRALRKTTLRIAPMFRIKLGNFEQGGMDSATYVAA
jgi:hypothetical protein